MMNTETSASAVEAAILQRIMMRHLDLLSAHGPERIMEVVEEFASHFGQLDEIGSSDVSCWVNEVTRILQNH